MSGSDSWGKPPASSSGADSWGKPPATTEGPGGWGKPAADAAGADGWGKPPSSAPFKASETGDGWGKPASTSNATSSGTSRSTGGGWGAGPATSDGWGKPAGAPSANGTKSEKEGSVEEVTKKLEDLGTEDEIPEDDAPRPKQSGLVGDTEEVVEVKLADLEGEGNGQLYQGVSTFEDLGLHPDLLKGIYGMGFQRPSKIQEKALPLLLTNPPKNMIGQSQSGTGKTAAFVLTMLSRINFSLDETQCLCLAPARELARQIMDVVKDMGKYTPVTTAFGIRDAVPRGEKIKAHIVIGTPGTVMELIKRRQLLTNNVRIFVLDEADNMLDQQGLGDQSIRVKNQMPRDCQIVLFSATFSPIVRQFAHRVAANANMISLRQEELSVDGIKQFYMDCKNEEHKVDVLCSIYGLLTIGQSIIFVRRRDVADALAARMTASGHKCLVLTGKYDSTDRDKAMDDFRDGRCKVLITTNVLARGIDILQVNLVINFDMPLDGANRPDPETYLHRIGRTGRFGRTGVSINFVHDRKSYEEMKAIENHFGRPIVRVPTDSYQEIKQILKKAVK
ncbi:RNA helicase required for poly(A+) mRNA export [Borealophlyctis nickersoniae]|nr:RNA helicase required for poly(A+) mRNA export [Borealophlyctis nickersoniae]